MQIGKCVTHIYHIHIYNKVREPNGSLLFHVKQKSMNLPVVSCKTAKYLMFHVKQLKNTAIALQLKVQCDIMKSVEKTMDERK